MLGFGVQRFGVKAYLEGQGDFVSRLIASIKQIRTQIIPIINLRTEGLGLRPWGLGLRAKRNGLHA